MSARSRSLGSYPRWCSTCSSAEMQGTTRFRISALTESRRGIRAVGSIRRSSALPGRALGVKSHKVEISLPAIGRPHDDPGGGMILFHAVAERPEGFEHIGDGAILDDQVDVVVHPGHSSE